MTELDDKRVRLDIDESTKVQFSIGTVYIGFVAKVRNPEFKAFPWMAYCEGKANGGHGQFERMGRAIQEVFLSAGQRFANHAIQTHCPEER